MDTSTLDLLRAARQAADDLEVPLQLHAAMNQREFHYGAVHDPIKALVECGSGRDVETIIVDGQILVDHGKAVRFDEAAMLREVQAERERIWQSVPEWQWTGKSVDDIVPPIYPVRD